MRNLVFPYKSGSLNSKKNQKYWSWLTRHGCRRTVTRLPGQGQHCQCTTCCLMLTGVPTSFGTMNCLVTSRWEDEMPWHTLYISLLQLRTMLSVSTPCIVQIRDRAKLRLKPQIITYRVLSHSGMKWLKWHFKNNTKEICLGYHQLYRYRRESTYTWIHALKTFIFSHVYDGMNICTERQKCYLSECKPQGAWLVLTSTYSLVGDIVNNYPGKFFDSNKSHFTFPSKIMIL